MRYSLSMGFIRLLLRLASMSWGFEWEWECECWLPEELVDCSSRLFRDSESASSSSWSKLLPSSERSELQKLSFELAG